MCTELYIPYKHSATDCNYSIQVSACCVGLIKFEIYFICLENIGACRTIAHHGFTDAPLGNRVQDMDHINRYSVIFLGVNAVDHVKRYVLECFDLIVTTLRNTS